MSDSENDRKHDLECLRLASELTQLATDLLDLDLKLHFLRMADKWTEQAELGPIAGRTEQAERALIASMPLQSRSYH